MSNGYNEKTLDHMFSDIKESLNRIEAQTTRHNGRLTKLERIVLVVGTATGAMLVMNGSQLVSFIKTII